jgi:hypothetical protein
VCDNISISSADSCEFPEIDGRCGADAQLEQLWSADGMTLSAEQPQCFPLSGFPPHPVFGTDIFKHILMQPSASLNLPHYDRSISQPLTVAALGNYDVARGEEICHGSTRLNFDGRMKRYSCHICSYRSDRSYNLLRHIVHRHSSGTICCPDCNIIAHDKEHLRLHWLNVHHKRHGLAGAGLSLSPALAAGTFDLPAAVVDAGGDVKMSVDANGGND